MMNRMQPQLWLVLALALAGGLAAAAQTNGVPAPTDYSSFSRFITERNIFDPNRQPRHSGESRPRTPIRTTKAHVEPAFTLVGTMSYEKGMFAFFDGNNSDLRKVLSESGAIAGYLVTEVTLAGVTLQTADKKETIKMKIGEMMRQEDGAWRPAGLNESGNHSGTVSEPAGDSSPGAGAPAASALEQNEILKKLMQQREQEQ